MERTFELEPISFREYDSLADRLRLPNTRGRQLPKHSYFRLLTQVTHSFNSLMGSLNDSDLIIETLWFPNGTLSLGAANRRTRRYRSYLDDLREFANAQDQFYVSVGYGGRSKDVFNYVQENGLWVLRRVVIRHRNLERYNLISGVDIFSISIYNVAAIHDKAVVSPALAGRVS